MKSALKKKPSWINNEKREEVTQGGNDRGLSKKVGAKTAKRQGYLERKLTKKKKKKKEGGVLSAKISYWELF